MANSRCLISNSGCGGSTTRRYRRAVTAVIDGFTMVEILVVVVIIAIAAAIAIPMFSSASGIQVRSAANTIAADMEYARSMAISRQQYYSVVFSTANDSYEVHDENGDVIAHPVKKGFDYVMDFPNEARLSRVDISAASFNATSEIKFDYLGSPLDGGGSPLNSGAITVQADATTLTINVEPVTGFISISE